MKQTVLMVLVGLLVMGSLVGCNKRTAWNKASDEDPRVQAAIAKAKETWPDFVKAFKNRKGVLYTATVKYSDGTNEEEIEMDVLGVTDTEIKGKVTSYPKNVTYEGKKMLNSQIISVPVDSLIDWYYENSNGDGFGGEVAKIKSEIQRNG